METVGFIGLGAMGYPMAEQLAEKLPMHTKLLVFDVLEDATRSICAKYADKVQACSSSMEVAEGSASNLGPNL